VYRYSRADLLRILRLIPRQLQTWEKAGLVTAAEDYSFFDLVQIKKVRDLCAQRVRPAVIRQSLEAMQKQVAAWRIHCSKPAPIRADAASLSAIRGGSSNPSPDSSCSISHPNKTRS